nr:WD repeat-containing protein 91-like [Lytechinus pictus]
MSESVQRMDELIRDYLLYRGLTNSLKSFDAELKNDKDKGFRADKILEQLLGFISTFDLLGLKNYWEHLERRIFSHLEYTHAHNVNKLRISILRLYVVNAIQSNRTEKVTEFFEKLIPEIQSQTEWKECKQWAGDTILSKVVKILSIIFQSMPLPILLNFDAEHQKIVELQEENAKLQEQVIKLTDQVAKYEDQMGRLQEQVKLLSSSDKSESQDVSDHSSNTGLGESQGSQLRSSLKSTSKKSPSPNIGRRLLSSTSSTPSTTGSKSGPQGVRGALSSLLGPKKNQDQSQQVAKTKEGIGPSGSSVTGGGGGVAGSGMKKVDFASSSPTHKPTETNSQNQIRLQQQQTFDKQRQELFSKSQQSQAQPKTAEKTLSSTSGIKDVELSSILSFKPEASQSSPSHRSEPPPLTQKPSPISTFYPGEEESHGTFLILSQDEYTEHHSSITYSRFSPSSTSVASMDIDGVLLLGSSVGSVKLYDCEGKKPLKEADMDPAFPRVVSVACNPGGTTFVCSAASPVGEWGSDLSKPGSPLHGTCKLTTFDLKTLKLQKELPLARSAGCINCTSFNHNGNLSVTGASDGMVRLFDIQRHECLLSWRAHQGQVYAAQFSPAETSVYSMGSDGKFTEWSIHKVGQKLLDMPIHDGATGPFVVSGFGGYRQQQNPRGKLFAFDSSGNYVLTCAPHGGVIYKLNKEKGMLRTLTILGHRTPVVSVDWCTTLNTGVCLSGSMDGRVQVTTLLSQ